tara:strand:- start:309 stop:812 length:504 start_codon:yes stop_codon:yes gene_type:complete
MNTEKFKKTLVNLSIILLIFFIDRFSKIYILSIAETNGNVDIYINSFLNFVLYWNTGIGFGLFAFEQSQTYNFVTLIIIFVNLIIIYLIYKSTNFKIYFFMMILGGSLGNLYDRINFNAVPDFIDLHINNFHWFIFNIADIFISLGVICLIYVEIFFKDKLNNEQNN